MWALVNVGPCKNLPISISSLSLMKLRQKTKRRYILECIMSRSLIQCQKNLSKRPASLEMKTNWTLENNNMERWRLSIKVVQLWNHDDSSRSCWCCVHFIFQLLSFIFLKILFIYFQREGKGKRKRGRETSMCGCLLRVPHWACALTGNWTCNHLIHRPVLNPLSHTSQGCLCFYEYYYSGLTRYWEVSIFTTF